MADDDVKWIKVKVGMFDGDSFKKIKKAKIDGIVDFRDKLTAVWFELLDLAGKVNNGGLFVNSEVAYRNFEDIAIMLDREQKEIELCMNFFINNKMIEIIENCYLLSNWEKYQNNDGLEKIKLQNAQRQARFREKKKQLALGLKEESSNAIVTLPITLRNANSLKDNNNSISSSNNLLTKKEDGMEEEKGIIDVKFTEFWSIYPKKVGKADCLKWYQKKKPDDGLQFKILDKLCQYKKTSQWTKNNGQFVPNPLTWLHQERWDDEIKPDNNQIMQDIGLPDEYKEYM